MKTKLFNKCLIDNLSKTKPAFQTQDYQPLRKDNNIQVDNILNDIDLYQIAK